MNKTFYEFEAMLKALFVILALLGFAFVVVWFGNEGMARNETMECQRWERDSNVYPDWYATGWQTEQCLNYGIDLR